MFTKTAGGGKEGIETVIGPSVRIEGNFVCQGGISIEGEVKGTVATAGYLDVGDKAVVTADVSAKEAKIGGEIKGNVRIEGYLELTASAKIVGDIEASSLSIARGAMIKGKCSIGAFDAKMAKPAKAPATTNE